MKLTGKEKKLLTILHEARFVKGKLLKEYERLVRGKFSFSYEEVHKSIKKFLKRGLLEELKLKDEDIMYFHTKKVKDSMLDKSLIFIGQSNPNQRE
ncbi:hypothetical protein J4422_01305 [Candidatus Pacearchaeota archaeon]|nr:hypothetical protein [Candidatus Pacearchaeota archaeon]